MSKADETARAKAAARRRARDARRAITGEERARAADLLAETLAALPELADARTVLAYGATAEELDVGPAVTALRARGVTVAYPRIESPGVLGLYVVDSEDELVDGQLGIREPASGATRIDPEALDAVLVPGVAFDEHGRRLGYGGGYYDRLLPQLRPECVRIGVAFDEQVLDELPALEHDEGVQYVATPSRVLNAASYLP